MTIEQVEALRTKTDYLNELPAYAWPGGYPIFYLTSENDTLCSVCATEALDNEEWDEWKPSTYGVHWEGSPLFCSECNAEVEKAYGDPDSEEA